MPFTFESITSVESIIRTGLPQVISVMVNNLLLVSTTNISPYLLFEGGSSATNSSNHSQPFNTSSLVWFGYLNTAIVPIGGVVSGFVTNYIGVRLSLQVALAIIIFLRLISMFFKEAWSFFTVVILTNFCSEFFKGPVFTHISESAEPHLRETLSASASSAMTFGQFQQILMITFLSRTVITYINCGLPLVCIFLLIIVPETAHSLILKNKLEKARKSLAWYRGWVDVSVVEPEFQKLLEYHREEQLKQMEEENEKNGNENKNEIIITSNDDTQQPSAASTAKADTAGKMIGSIPNVSSLKDNVGKFGQINVSSSASNIFSRMNVLKNTVGGESNKLRSLKNTTSRFNPFKKNTKSSENTDDKSEDSAETKSVSLHVNVDDITNKCKTAYLDEPTSSSSPSKVLNDVDDQLASSCLSTVEDNSKSLNEITTDEVIPSNLNKIKSASAELYILRDVDKSDTINKFKNISSSLNPFKSGIASSSGSLNQTTHTESNTSGLDKLKGVSSQLNIMKSSSDVKSIAMDKIKTASARLNPFKSATEGDSESASKITNEGESSTLDKLKGASSHLNIIKNASSLGALKNVSASATSHLGALKGTVMGESSPLNAVKDKMPLHLLESGYSTVKNVKKFVKQSFILPLALVTFSYFLVYFTGTTILLSQPGKILHILNSPLDPTYVALVLSGANVLGATVSVMVIKSFGKHLITFISLMGMTVCSVSISLYSYWTGIHYSGHVHNATIPIIPHQNGTFASFEAIPSLNAYNWIPLVILFVLCIISNFGICNLPWVLVGELFSNDTRAIGTGLASGITSLMDSFCNSSLETLLIDLGFSGLYGFYAGVSVAGAIILRFILPNTEGKSLEEIEKYFDDLPLFNERFSRFYYILRDWIIRVYNTVISNIFYRKKSYYLKNSDIEDDEESIAGLPKITTNYGSLEHLPNPL